MVYVTKLPENLPKTYQFDKKEKIVNSIFFDDDNQVPPRTEIDVGKMLEKLVKDKLSPIFEALGWKMSDLAWYWIGKALKKKIQESLFSLDEFEETPKKSLKRA